MLYPRRTCSAEYPLTQNHFKSFIKKEEDDDMVGLYDEATQ